MKRQHFLHVLLTCVFLFTTLHGVHAQTASISGDERCGASATTTCGVKDAKAIVVDTVYKLILPIGSSLLVLFIMYRFVTAYKALVQGNSGAYKEALGKAVNALIGLMVILLVIGGGYVVALKYLGTADWATAIFNLFSTSFIPHAYAADQSSILPNPTTVTNLYDFLLLLVRLAVRWFIFPAVLVIWVWTGFSYVAAQGAPEKIKLAHKWLIYALITTVIVMTTEGFLFAVRGTIQQILPQQQITTQVSTGGGVTINPDAPAPGTAGSACTVPNSTITGQLGTDGVCRSASRGNTGAPIPVTNCNGQPIGQACPVPDSTKTGACGYDSTGSSYQCYAK